MTVAWSRVVIMDKEGMDTGYICQKTGKVLWLIGGGSSLK